jgi:hypothetical protein
VPPLPLPPPVHMVSRGIPASLYPLTTPWTSAKLLYPHLHNSNAECRPDTAMASAPATRRFQVANSVCQDSMPGNSRHCVPWYLPALVQPQGPSWWQCWPPHHLLVLAQHILRAGPREHIQLHNATYHPAHRVKVMRAQPLIEYVPCSKGTTCLEAAGASIAFFACAASRLLT